MGRMPEPPLSPPDDPAEQYFEEAEDALWQFRHRIGEKLYEKMKQELGEALYAASQEREPDE